MAVTHPHKRCAGSTPARRTGRLVRLAASRTPASHAGRMGSIPIRATESWGRLPTCQSRWQVETCSRDGRLETYPTNGQVVEPADTRRSERRACEGMGVRLSPWSLRSGLESGFQRGLISRRAPAPHAGNEGATPSRSTSGGRKAVIRQPWELETVGSIPTPLTCGLMVQRDDTSSAYWKSGFDSRWVHWKVAGYGWPGRSAKAVLPTEMRVRLPCLPLDCFGGEKDIMPVF